MSVALDHANLTDAEKIATAAEMVRLGLAASVPGEGRCLVTAHRWFNLAAHQGDADGHYYRQQLTLEMSTAEIARAQREAREWLRVRQPAFQAAA